jgi:hypothetical protein
MSSLRATRGWPMASGDRPTATGEGKGARATRELTHRVFDELEAFQSVLPNRRGEAGHARLPARAVRAAHLRREREAGRYVEADLGHLRKVRALAAQEPSGTARAWVTWR